MWHLCVNDGDLAHSPSPLYYAHVSVDPKPTGYLQIPVSQDQTIFPQVNSIFLLVAVKAFWMWVKGMLRIKR